MFSNGSTRRKALRAVAVEIRRHSTASCSTPRPLLTGFKAAASRPMSRTTHLSSCHRFSTLDGGTTGNDGSDGSDDADDDADGNGFDIMSEIENFDWGPTPTDEHSLELVDEDPTANKTPEEKAELEDVLLKARLRSIIPDMASEVLEKHVSPIGLKLTEIDAPQEMYEEHVVSEQFVEHPDDWRASGFHFAEDYWVTRDDYPEINMTCMSYHLGYPSKEGLRLDTMKERMLDSDLYYKERIFRTPPEYVSSVADEFIPHGTLRTQHYRKYVLDQARNMPNTYRAANAVKFMKMETDVQGVVLDQDVRDRYKDLDEETKAVFMDAATIIEFRHPELTYERKVEWLNKIEETWALISGERPDNVLTKTVEKLLVYDRGLAEIEKFKKQRVDLRAYEDDASAEDDYEFEDD